MTQQATDRNETEAEPNAGGASAEPQGEARGSLPPRARIDVKHVILVLSGKGGVGKSTVAVNLAYSLANHGRTVGLLDLDLHGPSVPKMLGLEGQVPAISGQKIEPVQVTGSFTAMSMGFLLSRPDSPVIWRGPMKMSVIQQFLEDVDWGPLDYLVVDLPPGTGDEALTIAQLAPNLRGAIIVTTPQDVAVVDAVKALKFIEKLEIPVLGIIENMSGMVCPHCGGTVDMFGRGGGANAARDHGVPYLGTIPLDPEMMKAGDEGRPYILRHADSPTWNAIDGVMENLVGQVES